jgi:hypothetical protein
MATRTAGRRSKPIANQPNEVAANHPMTEAKGTQGQRVERRGGGGNPTRTCRTTRRRREPMRTCRTRPRWRGTNANVSKDTEAKGTQCQSVQRRGGEGNPTPTCRKMRRRKESNANVSNDAEAEGTQHQRVERRGGERNLMPTCRPTPRQREPNANVSKDAEAKGTQRR